MNLRIVLQALILLTGLVFLTPSPTLAHHCKGAHADPSCDSGGGGGGDTVPLSVTFRCSDVGVDRSCAPAGVPDRIQGDGGGPDGGGPFVEGVDKVNAELTSFGRFRLNTGGNKKTGSERNVYWDFTEGALSSVPLTAVQGGVTTTDTLGFPYRTVIHLNRRNDIADLRDITVGQTMFLDMWGDVVISDGGSTSSIAIRFDSKDANNECPESPGSEDVPVFRESDTKWIVDVPVGTKACIRVQDSEDPSNSGVKGDYVLGPFRYEFEALP